MSVAQLAALRAPPKFPARAARLSLAVGLASLAYVFWRFLVIAASAIRSPYQRDYGEGIVWQQMRLMFAGKGYGPIDGFPAIVFHYPPVYHATVEALTLATGFDPLLLGRAVSLVSALACLLFVALIAARIGRPVHERSVALFSGVFAALAVINLPLVQTWALVMRVDMLAIALSLGGIWLGIRAIARPAAVYASAVCFVAAFFTKQTSIAAPFAVFAALLLVRPAVAWRGIALGIVLGLAVLLSLFIVTDGGIFRHLVLYNINRFDSASLGIVPAIIERHLLFFGAVAFGIAQVVKQLWRTYPRKLSWAEARAKLAQRSSDAAALIVILYFLAKTAMNLLVAKSGANANYLMEWMIAGAIFIGPAVSSAVACAAGKRNARAWPSILVPIALSIPALVIAVTPPARAAAARQHRRELDELSASVRAADRPVISDDMVMLLRSGKEVLWEPAIFGELASTGAWDERPFVNLIRQRRFGFFITEGDRGDPQFDSRYTPAVDAAIEQAYPRRCRLAGYVIHMPLSGQAAPAGCRPIT